MLWISSSLPHQVLFALLPSSSSVCGLELLLPMAVGFLWWHLAVCLCLRVVYKLRPPAVALKCPPLHLVEARTLGSMADSRKVANFSK